jgi:hypothetical protein
MYSSEKSSRSSLKMSRLEKSKTLPLFDEGARRCSMHRGDNGTRLEIRTTIINRLWSLVVVVNQLGERIGRPQYGECTVKMREAHCRLSYARIRKMRFGIPYH